MIGARVGKIRNNANSIAGKVRRRKRELLTRFGMDVEQIAVASMPRTSQKSNRVSAPGSPPLLRSSQPNLTTFGQSLSGDSVLVGPMLVRSSESTASSPIPGTLELGAVRTIRRKRKTGRTRAVRQRIRPRPFVRPAAIKSLAKLQSDVRARGIA